MPASIHLGSGGFCADAWERTAVLQDAICEHPFNRSLADGSLAPDRFGFYMVQDSRYLVGFSRALAVAAARAPEVDAAAFFLHSAHGALVVESSLHSGELERLAWSKERADSLPTSPACLAYVSYLGSVALWDPWPVLVAALVPCFWVYHHVGTSIMARTPDVEGHPYGAWIATYADEQFGEAVASIRGIADRAAASATEATRRQMLEAFTRASEYEWLFWESAWTQEAWPTARWLREP